MKLERADEKRFEDAIDIINMAKKHLRAQGIDQWQNGYPNEPYNELQGEWQTDEKYVVVHRMAFSDLARGKGASTEAFRLVEELAKEKGVNAFRVDTDNDNEKMKHILNKCGFTYRGDIWFDNSVKIAYDKVIK